MGSLLNVKAILFDSGRTLNYQGQGTGLFRLIFLSMLIGLYSHQ